MLREKVETVDSGAQVLHLRNVLHMSNLMSEVEARASLPTPAVARAIREHAGASQENLARAVGVTRMSVCRWEKGTHRPRGLHLLAYAAVLRDLQRVAGGR